MSEKIIKGQYKNLLWNYNTEEPTFVGSKGRENNNPSWGNQ
jgi:hypothetical protein